MIFHDVDQNSEAWLALRLGKATASSFACVMAHDNKPFGEPAKRYALQLALEQVTQRKAEHSFSNEHTERGHEQEPIARMLYAEETFSIVANGGFFDCGEYGASPDGLIGEHGTVEFKSVTAPTHYATLLRGSFDPAYRWQLVGELDCTGRAWIDFVSYCSDFPEDQQLLVYRLEREQCIAEIERLRARRAEFLNLVRETRQTLRPQSLESLLRASLEAA